MDTPPRPALIGSAISGFFGALWAVWAASGLAGAAGTAVAVAGVVLGIGVVAGAVWFARRAPAGVGDGSMFTSRAYRLIVGAEVLAIVVGNVVLGRSGLGDYVIAWTAFVVGVHFLAFGRAFDRTFTWIGGLMVVAAVAGAVTGVAGGGADAVLVVVGVPCAVVLLVAGGRRVVEAARVGTA